MAFECLLWGSACKPLQSEESVSRGWAKLFTSMLCNVTFAEAPLPSVRSQVDKRVSDCNVSFHHPETAGVVLPHKKQQQLQWTQCSVLKRFTFLLRENFLFLSQIWQQLLWFYFVSNLPTCWSKKKDLFRKYSVCICTPLLKQKKKCRIVFFNVHISHAVPEDEDRHNAVMHFWSIFSCVVPGIQAE